MHPLLNEEGMQELLKDEVQTIMHCIITIWLLQTVTRACICSMVASAARGRDDDSIF